MNIGDACILASSGAMLAPGEFLLEGIDAPAFPVAGNSMIAVSPGSDGQGATFALVGNAVREADGLWSADPATHTIALHPSVPALEHLLAYPSFALSRKGIPSSRTRFTLSAEHSAVARVALGTGGARQPGSEPLLGNAASGTIEMRRAAHGIAFELAMRVEEGRRGEERAPPFTARVKAELSFATMALAGSRLWWQSGAEKWSQPETEQTGPLARVLTLDRAGGTPYFRGTLDLGGTASERPAPSWVKARIFEHRLRLRAQERVHGHGGFVSANSYGPDLILENLGSAAWKAMLADGNEAVLESSGAGIRRVEGVTGRDAGEIGPHEQPVTALRVRLSRSAEGLRMAFDGRLGALRQTPSQPPLGPELRGDFVIPAAFLFATGISLPGQWADRQESLKRS